MSSKTNVENETLTELLDKNESGKYSNKNIQIVSNERNLEIYHENDSDVRCGFFGWTPEWLQRLASKKSYVIAYGILGMNQSALSAYFIGTISTIEKRFKLPSTSSGIITSSWDVGSTGALLLMAYFGSGGHKTRWVAAGALLAAISCYMRYLPHLLYGPGNDITQFSSNSTENINFKNLHLCNDSQPIDENCSLNSEGMITFLILIFAQVAIGIGTSAYYTLGAAYLDDNALKNKFPFLLAAAAFLRYFGPTLGFLLSSYTLSIYIDPNETPPFGQDDPRWIGAWYLGWLVFGSAEIILALVISFFPKILPREADRRKTSGYQENKKVRSMKDFKQTLLRLIKNPILMFNTFSSTFYIFGMMGYWIFMPKYIETQFRKTASAANLITGTVGLICTAIGIIISGSVVSKFKPRATYVAAWNVFTESVDVLGHMAFAFLGCLKDDLHGNYNLDGSWNTTNSCNAECDCNSAVKYSPVCSMDQSYTFYSPCHAGCTAYNIINGTKVFQNCSCIADFGQATEGPCPIDCEQNFVIFLGLLCLMKFLSSTGRAGNTVIQFRSVSPEDKSVAIALAEVVLGVFTFIPAPILFGWLLDSSCLIWGITCGKTGNCWLYDGKILRYLLNLTSSGAALGFKLAPFLTFGSYVVSILSWSYESTQIEKIRRFISLIYFGFSAFLFVGVLLDVGVLWKVGKLKMYDEDMSTSDKKRSNENKEF